MTLGPVAGLPLRRRAGAPAMNLVPAAGDLLPDLSLSDSSGREVPLRALGGEQTLILFMRHFG